MTNDILELSDGRSLSYRQYGDPEGTPVMFFHGYPGSNRDFAFVDPKDLARTHHCSVIATSRPGYGESTDKPGRQLLDWPTDVCELADALQIDKFAVVGYSGGGPYALACAYAIPERLTSVVVVAGVGPAQAPGMKTSIGLLYTTAPEPFRSGLMTLMQVSSKLTPDQVALQMARAALPTCDRVALDDPVVSEGLMATWREAFRNG